MQRQIIGKKYFCPYCRVLFFHQNYHKKEDTCQNCKWECPECRKCISNSSYRVTGKGMRYKLPLSLFQERFDLNQTIAYIKKTYSEEQLLRYVYKAHTTKRYKDILGDDYPKYSQTKSDIQRFYKQPASKDITTDTLNPLLEKVLLELHVRDYSSQEGKEEVDKFISESILALYDQGISYEKIRRITGFSKDKIQEVVQAFKNNEKLPEPMLKKEFCERYLNIDNQMYEKILKAPKDNAALVKLAIETAIKWGCSYRQVCQLFKVNNTKIESVIKPGLTMQALAESQKSTVIEKGNGKIKIEKRRIVIEKLPAAKK